MDIKKKFQTVFGKAKPVLAMLHLKGETKEEILKRVQRETEIYLDGGVDAVIVENYFGNEEAVEMTLAYLQENKPEIIYGVNMLDDDERGFMAAERYNAKFIQLDSVAGHITPKDDIIFGENIAKWRKNTPALVLGGVRFKYQPYKSGRSLEEDLCIAMERCDAIVVTGEGTGLETEMDKILRFREIVGEFPLVIGAGIVPENCAERFKIADGAIVGSYFKDNYRDDGEVDIVHVQNLMHAITSASKQMN